MDETNLGGRQRRSCYPKVTLITLLYWLSTIESSTIIQPRVRRANRQVSYRHTVQGNPRGRFVPFVRTNSRESYEENKARRRRTREDAFAETKERSTAHGWQGSLDTYEYDQERFWVYSSPSPSSGSLVESKNQHDLQQQRSLWRKLYDQFVGEEKIHGGNETNVTTEINLVGVNNETIFSNSTEDSFVATTSNETVAEFNPLRIRALLSEEQDFLTTKEREQLFDDMLSSALLSWSSSLRVDPVVGNLTVDPDQLNEGTFCGPGNGENGLPYIVVPLSHLDDGIPNTDTIVYLNLAFVTQRNKTIVREHDITNTTNTTTDLMEETKDGLRRRRVKEKAKKLEDDIDSVFETVITEDNETSSVNIQFSDTCTGEYLAASSFCSTDQYDRPTAALLHICIDDKFFDSQKLKLNIMTLMHELGHALGFNALSMAHFRNQDGTPITDRGEDGEIPETLVECTGPSANRTFANVILPSPEILKLHEVRGGVRVAEVVTPSVLQVVRNQFDCQELMGAELESAESLPFDLLEEGHGCIGDHWERRVFATDLMNPIMDDSNYSPRISTLTLAYFADSGWYQVDLQYAEVAAGWGRRAGCSFVNNTCIDENGQVPPENAQFFCDNVPTTQSRSVAESISGCTADLSRKAVCSMAQYDYDLPPEFQYFKSTYGTDVGGNDPFFDYCPTYTGFANGLCSEVGNGQVIRADQVEVFGERNSRCLLGNIGSLQATALCIPIACVVEDQTLRVEVNQKWHLCEEAGQVITDGSVSITCPDPVRTCPTFYCPFDCLGTDGVCDFDSGKCMCERLTSTEKNEDDQAFLETLDCFIHDDTDNVIALRPVIRPDTPNGKEIVLPPSDSPLSDYYVADTRALKRRVYGPGLVFIMVSTVGVFLLVVGFFLRNHLKDNGSVTDSDAIVVNRNKDKMVATVLVDMRIRNQETLNESLAETDDQLTGSEASEMPSDTLSDISIGRQSSVQSEMDKLQAQIEVEDTHEPQIIRRRRAGAPLYCNNQKF